MRILALICVVSSLAFGQGQTCGPGKDCRVSSLSLQPFPFSSFPACNSTRYGSSLFDGDAGTPKYCNASVWTSYGGGSSSGDSFFRDAGVSTTNVYQYIKPSAPQFTSAGLTNGMLWLGNTASGPASFVTPSFITNLSFPLGLSHNQGIIWTTENSNISNSGYINYNDVSMTFYSGVTGSFNFSTGFPVSTNQTIVNMGRLILGVNAGGNAVQLNTGALLDLGGGSFDFLISDGTNIVTAVGSGLKIGGSSASAITGSFRNTVTLDGGEIAAESCVDTNVTVSGCNVNAECVVGMAQGQAENGTFLFNCWVSDGNAAVIRTCNIGADAKFRTSGTYSLRCFNP